MKKEKLTETELCRRFVSAHPRPDHLYYEVEVWGGVADIIHYEKVITIYEAKTELSLKLLQQCIDRKHCGHYVYAVIPYDVKGSAFMRRLFKDYGIGVIAVRKEHRYSKIKDEREMFILCEEASPTINRTLVKRPKLLDYQKQNKPGSQHERVTAFGNMVDSIKDIVRRSPNSELHIDKAFEHQRYYDTLKQFKSNLYQWIRKDVIKGLEMEKGILKVIDEQPNN